jgi:hypothetical protein
MRKSSLLVIAVVVLIGSLSKIALCDLDQDQAVAEYRALGLPFPAADAPLVQFQQGGEGIRNYVLGFLVRPASGKTGATVLIGFRKVQVSEKLVAVEPNQVTVDWLNPIQEEERSGLATAIQCRARGWNKLADQLEEKSLHAHIGSGIWIEPSPGIPLRTALAQLGWSYWTGQIAKPDRDRAAICTKLQATLTLDPTLKTPENASLLASLRKALGPMTAKPGTVDALVEKFVDATEPLPFMGIGYPAPIYLAVSSHGFEAVPALISHLEDDRLTRALQYDLASMDSHYLRVNDIASYLLEDIAGDGLSIDWSKQGSRTVSKESAKQWWNSAQKQSEADYFTTYVFPSRTGLSHRSMLEVLTKKYPQRLPEIFTRSLKNGPADSGSIAQAVSESNLPREEKLLLLQQPTPDANLPYLRTVDEKLFAEELVKVLNKLPATPAGSYWQARETGFAYQVIQTGDPRAWSALTIAARRADVWLRMEYLRAMYGCDFSHVHWKERLAFLGQFLNDAEVRESKGENGFPATEGKYSGPYAGFFFGRLEVRDFAAIQIASMLDLPDQPTPAQNWNSDQWAAFRARVTAAMPK